MSSNTSGSFWISTQNKDFENALAVFDKDTANRWDNDTTNCWDNVANAVGEKMQRKSRSIMSFFLLTSAHLRLWKKIMLGTPKTKLLKTLWLCLTRTLPTAGIMLPTRLAKNNRGSQEIL
ncbi:unnamed protein product [Prunus brigantina]